MLRAIRAPHLYTGKPGRIVTTETPETIETLLPTGLALGLACGESFLSMRQRFTGRKSKSSGIVEFPTKSSPGDRIRDGQARQFQIPQSDLLAHEQPDPQSHHKPRTEGNER